MSEDNLSVLLCGRTIGTLLAVRGGAHFQFNEEVVQQYDGLPLLSTALRVQHDPFNKQKTARWFSGLLPEDSRLAQLQRYFGVSDGNYLAILREIGWECAGAVTVQAESVKSDEEQPQELLSLTREELALRLTALPEHPFDDSRALRVSLGGFQEKLCVTLASPLSVEGGRAHVDAVRLPLDGAISTHILKPQPQRFEGMIEGEAWAMTAAAYAAPTAKVALLVLDEAPATLVVERFDRKTAEGTLRRIHQEDCAQALGLGPEQKYAASGSPKKSDPSFQQIAALLESYSSDPLIQLEGLFKQMFINVALGNTDAHAKNYALLHPNDATVELSPLYDVVPATEITPGVATMGMRIDGRLRIDRISRQQVVNEGFSWGLTRRHIDMIVDELFEKLKVGIMAANELFPHAAERHAEAALNRLEKLSVRQAD